VVSSDEFDLGQWDTLVTTYREAARWDLMGPPEGGLPELSGEADWARITSKASPEPEVSTLPAANGAAGSA